MPVRHAAPRPPRPPMWIPPWARALLLLLCAWGAVWVGTRIVNTVQPLLPTMMVSRNVQPLPGKPPATGDTIPHRVQPAR